MRHPLHVAFVGILATGLLAEAAIAGGTSYNLYWGNFHSHSSLSDGAGPPDDAYDYARNTAGIDILAISDHTHMTSASEWSFLGTSANSNNVPGEFIALRSQEFGILNDFGHLNIHACDVKNPNSTTNLPATYNFIIQNNGIGQYCHPNPTYGTHFNSLAYDPSYEGSMYGIEVVNGFYSGDYEDIWIQALDNGWKLAPYGNQDNHQANWGNQQNSNDANRIYLTGVYATELTRDAVFEAMRSRRVFAMEQRPEGDLIQIEFRVGDDLMGSEITVPQFVTFEATVTSLNGSTLCNRLELWKDGEIVDTHVEIGPSISASFFQSGLEVGAEHYYFVKGRQVDGDLAWSAPIWITVEESPTDVADTLPAKVDVLPNVPNPFSPETSIRFILPTDRESYDVGLVIVDSAGRVVRDMGTRSFHSGEQAWVWDGRKDDGDRAAAGVYHYRLTGPSIDDRTGRMVLLSR